MTGRERFLKTLRFEQTGRPLHFEMVFELTQEASGLKFRDWSPANAAACMAIYEKIVRRFGEDDVFAADQTVGGDGCSDDCLQEFGW